MLAGISGEKAPRSRRGKGDVAMGSTPLFSQRLRVALGVLCRRLQGGVSAPPPRMRRPPRPPIHLAAAGPQHPSPAPGASINRCARPVRRERLHVPRRPGRPHPDAPAPGGASAPATPPRTVVPRPGVPPAAGAAVAPTAPLALRAGRPGGSVRAGRATGMSLRPPARAAPASAPRRSAAGGGWRVSSRAG